MHKFSITPTFCASYIATDCQSANLFLYRAPFGSDDQILNLTEGKSKVKDVRGAAFDLNLIQH
jgi:hypothetical protein